MTRTALVTGSAAGIGRACARQLARDGLAVGILDLHLANCQRVVDEIVAEGGRAIALEADIADRTQVDAAFAKLREAFGPVTVVVNNAGVTATTAFKDITDELWDKVLTINLKGSFIVTQTALPDMEAAQWGRIVNISSSSAQSGAPRMAHYASSKGGMIAMTRALAQELGPLGITVNNIPPGAVMNTIMSEANVKNFPMSMDALIQATPVRRTGEPEDIANACSWLVSEASGYVTGQTIGVNGGRIVS